MTSASQIGTNRCRTADISAYIDGELAPDAEMELELHMAACASCRHILNEQKTLLLALDIGLDEDSIELPEDFSRSVIAHAESSVGGLRRPNERMNAALVVSGLLILCTAAAAFSSDGAFAVIKGGLNAAGAVALTAGHFIYDFSLGSAVVVRTLFANFVAASAGSAILFSAVAVAAGYLFSTVWSRRR